MPHHLRLTADNYDENGDVRQLFGLSIAAKRYVIYATRCGGAYCSHRKCVTVINPKAHGLIFFAPSEQQDVIAEVVVGIVAIYSSARI